VKSVCLHCHFSPVVVFERAGLSKVFLKRD
jgi:hypothetical protein